VLRRLPHADARARNFRVEVCSVGCDEDLHQVSVRPAPDRKKPQLMCGHIHQLGLPVGEVSAHTGGPYTRLVRYHLSAQSKTGATPGNSLRRMRDPSTRPLEGDVPSCPTSSRWGDRGAEDRAQHRDAAGVTRSQSVGRRSVAPPKAERSRPEKSEMVRSTGTVALGDSEGCTRG